jgi:hypothetical protein
MCGCDVGANYQQFGGSRFCSGCFKLYAQSTVPEIKYGEYNKTKDNINPDHYKQGKLETIDIIESATGENFDGFLIGNVVKYVSRYKYKNGLEDLKKAQWYLQKLIDKKEN